MAFLSDVHGNLPALEAVLRELRGRLIDEIYVAGDLLLGGDEPVEVFKRLRQAGAQCALGISDRALVEVEPSALRPADPAERSSAARFRETREALGELVLKYLEKLPEAIRIPLMDGAEVLVVHGSPADPTTELAADLSDEEMLQLLDDDPADLVICGGSHVPFQRALPETRVINVGSVGAAPEGRVAHYTVLTPRMDGTLVEQSWVDY